MSTARTHSYQPFSPQVLHPFLSGCHAGAISIGGISATKVSQDGQRQSLGWLPLRGASCRRPSGSARRSGSCSGRSARTPAACRRLSERRATDASSDGRVVVGLAWIGCGLTHAFRWEESTGMVNLGSSVAGRASLATGVSGDGKVVVGHQGAGHRVQSGRTLGGRPSVIISRPRWFRRNRERREHRRHDRDRPNLQPSSESGDRSEFLKRVGMRQMHRDGTRWLRAPQACASHPVP